MADKLNESNKQSKTNLWFYVFVVIITACASVAGNYFLSNYQFKSKKFEVTFSEKGKCYVVLLTNLEILKNGIESECNEIEKKLKNGDTIPYSIGIAHVTRLFDSVLIGEIRLYPFLSYGQIKPFYDNREEFYNKIKKLFECWKPGLDIYTLSELKEQTLDGYIKYREYLKDTLNSQLFKENP
jgi:hypothetical protein